MALSLHECQSDGDRTTAGDATRTLSKPRLLPILPVMRRGQLIGIGGAIAVLVSLWLPWYSIDVTALRETVMGSGTTQLPAGWTQFLQGLLAALPGSVTADGWTAMATADIVMVAIVSAVMAVSVAAPTLPVAAQGAALAGLACAIIAAAHIADVPDPSPLFAVRMGPWVALVGGLAMLVGGGWASTGRIAGAEQPASSDALPGGRPPEFGTTSVGPPASR